MLLWTGLMTTSSSILRSRASTALLGLSNDSWERDSFSLGIRWDLRFEKVREVSHLWSVWGSERFGSICAAYISERSWWVWSKRVRRWQREDAPLAAKSAWQVCILHRHVFMHPFLSSLSNGHFSFTTRRKWSSRIAINRNQFVSSSLMVRLGEKWSSIKHKATHTT